MAVIFNDKVISGSVTGASITFTKQLPHRKGFAVQFKYSGITIAGEVKLQASVNGTDFVDVEDAVYAISDNSGNILWDFPSVNYGWVRLVCTSSSGAIMFEAWLLIKRPKDTE